MRKLWAAGAAIVVCLALGGVPVAAQEASGEPSAASAMPDGPALVTGTQTCAAGDPDSRTWDGPVLTGHNATINCTDVMSDERVSGPDSGEWNYVCHSDADMGCTYWGTTEIVGPDGTWVGTYTGTDDPGLWEAGEGGAVMIQVLEGTGAYEGWTFVAHIVTDLSNPATVNGLIHEGPPPPWGPLPTTASE
jgi:hypothetical protein